MGIFIKAFQKYKIWSYNSTTTRYLYESIFDIFSKTTVQMVALVALEL
jgi:hypothetical protein